jgi:ligand-binding sensor domain-containing protein
VSNSVNTVAEDNKHNLWIGTSNGLVVFDKRTGSFRKLVTINSVITISNLFLLQKKMISGWNRWGIAQIYCGKRFFSCFYRTKQDYTLLGNDIKTLLEDHKGNIWIGTWANGLSRFDITNSSLFHIRR